MRRRFIATLALGVCIGSVLTHKIVVDKYEHIHLKNKEVIHRLNKDVSNITVSRDIYRTSALELQQSVADLNKQIEALQAINKKYSVDTFQVTAYSPYDNVSGMENDGNPNVTSTGTKPRPGTVAVDPKVIPYGSKIIIVYEDGTVEHGVAEDCGGLIKGSIIDVFRQTYKEAVKHGRREATVIWYND